MACEPRYRKNGEAVCKRSAVELGSVGHGCLTNHLEINPETDLLRVRWSSPRRAYNTHSPFGCCVSGRRYAHGAWRSCFLWWHPEQETRVEVFGPMLRVTLWMLVTSLMFVVLFPRGAVGVLRVRSALLRTRRLMAPLLRSFPLLSQSAFPTWGNKARSALTVVSSGALGPLFSRLDRSDKRWKGEGKCVCIFGDRGALALGVGRCGAGQARLWQRPLVRKSGPRNGEEDGEERVKPKGFNLYCRPPRNFTTSPPNPRPFLLLNTNTFCTDIGRRRFHRVVVL